MGIEQGFCEREVTLKGYIDLGILEQCNLAWLLHRGYSKRVCIIQDFGLTASLNIYYGYDSVEWVAIEAAS
jgi:hypothetical protein